MSIYHGVTPIVPESFLGGSAPRLRRLSLNHTPFPGLPNLLLSATHLVDLHLWRIPNSGYFTPEAIVTGLSTSTSLKVLWLGFESPLSRPKRERRRPPPLTRSILPALTRFRFKGSLLGVTPVHEAIGKFVAARQLAGHPIIVSQWDVGCVVGRR